VRVSATWAYVVSEFADFVVDVFHETEVEEDVVEREEHQRIDDEPVDEGDGGGAGAEGFDGVGEEEHHQHPEDAEADVDGDVEWLFEPLVAGAAHDKSPLFSGEVELGVFEDFGVQGHRMVLFEHDDEAVDDPADPGEEPEK
jgi:hypothetical protein